MTTEELETLLPLLEDRIPFDEDIFETQENWELSLTNLLNDSRDILLNKLYPFEDYSSYLIPLNKYNWVIRCSVEIYNLSDKFGISSYSENKLSWTRYTDGISRSLMNELISHVGVPKPTIVEEETEGE